MPCSTSAAATLARDPAEVQHLRPGSQGGIDLLTVVEQVRPTVLIGTATVAGAFSQAEATPQT